MAKTPGGVKPHRVTVEFVDTVGPNNLRAVCACKTFEGPPRFCRARAEEDGTDHIQRIAYKYKEDKKGRKL